MHGELLSALGHHYPWGLKSIVRELSLPVLWDRYLRRPPARAGHGGSYGHRLLRLVVLFTGRAE